MCVAGYALFPSAQQASRLAVEPAVPVVVAAAQRRDVPIALRGLGTVQANRTVAVRSRVDGHLQRLAFAEGASVKEGDVLARIDPRPFESVLAQAKAKKAQDEAQSGQCQYGRLGPLGEAGEGERRPGSRQLVDQASGRRPGSLKLW